VTGHGKKGLLVWVLLCILNICVIFVFFFFSHITQISVVLKELNTFSNPLHNFGLHLV